MQKKDFWSGLIIMLISMGFIVGTFYMPWKDSQFDWYGAPGLVPAILAAMLFVSGLILFIRAARNSHFYAHSDAENTQDHILEPAKTDTSGLNLPKFLQSETSRILIVIGWCALYVFLLIGLKIKLFGYTLKLHYLISTTIYVAGFIWIFKGGNWLKSIIIGALTSVAVWLVFEKVFAVVLP